MDTGLGLTGGPITTTGTVEIDPTVVAQLGSPNSFTEAQATTVGTGSAVNGTTAGTASFDAGVSGLASAGNGAKVGVYGENASTGGWGVYGYSAAVSGPTSGVYGASDSSDGRGARGWASATTGSNYVVLGTSSSDEGTGVEGQAIAGTFVWADSTDADFVSTEANQFLIRASGGVGIGTAAPATALDVNGDVTTNGSVGIGTSTPAQKLDIKDGSIRLVRAGPWGLILDQSDNSDFTIQNGGQVRLTMPANGRVGIGETSPADRLDVNGDNRVGTGSTGCVRDSDGTVISGTCSSGGRLKRNITPFSEMLGKVAALRPVHFDWRAEEFPEKHFGRERSFGLIAQDVEKVLPEIVTEDEDGYKAVRYNKLPLLNTQAIEELKKEKDAEIEGLQKEVAELRALVELLQRRLGVEVSQRQ